VRAYPKAFCGSNVLLRHVDTSQLNWTPLAVDSVVRCEGAKNSGNPGGSPRNLLLNQQKAFEELHSRPRYAGANLGHPSGFVKLHSILLAP
jgi:hypothetical protein